MKDINLLPNETRKKSSLDIDDLRDKLEPKKILIGIMVLLVLIVIFFCPLLYNLIISKQLSLLESEYNDKKYNSTKVVNASIDTEKGKIDLKQTAISDIDKKNVDFSEVYTAVNGILPQGCTLSRFAYDGINVSIDGNYVEDIQLGEIISRAKRLNFFVVDDSATISYDTAKHFNFIFAIKGKEVK